MKSSGKTQSIFYHYVLYCLGRLTTELLGSTCPHFSMLGWQACAAVDARDLNSGPSALSH